MKNHHSAASRTNSQPKTPILTSDLRSPMCDLRRAPSQMYGSEIEGTSAGNIPLSTVIPRRRASSHWRSSIEDRSGCALRPSDGLIGSVHGSSLRDPHAHTLCRKVIMAAPEKIYAPLRTARIGTRAPVAAIVTIGRPQPAKLSLASPICDGANCRVNRVASVPLLKICISHRPRNPRRTCAE